MPFAASGSAARPGNGTSEKLVRHHRFAAACRRHERIISLRAVGELSARHRGLLFALVITAGVLNLVDRQIIAVPKPTFAADLGWSDDDYDTLPAWFQTAAAIGFLFSGWIADRLGVKWANLAEVAAWSVAALLHGWALTMAQFTALRIALGATEAMGTPTGSKTVAAVLPPRWRSTGFGATNAASSLGAILPRSQSPGWRSHSAGVAPSSPPGSSG
jgi:ACS family hexuronate transporter-like MFS transporter